MTDNAYPLVSAPGRSLSSRYLQLLDDDGSLEGYGVAQIQNVLDSVYLTRITVGGEDFMNVIDTGSADTWVAGSGFKCVSLRTKKEILPENCKFAKEYVPTKSFVPIPDQHFNISYADGEYLNGVMGRETVRLGNITVDNQEVGIINLAAWNGDGISSGLIGLAFPSVTRAYPGSDPKADKKGTNVPYNPIFTSMWRKKLVEPYFSIALNRAAEGPGVLALGGLPRPPVRFETKFAITPLQFLAVKTTDPKKPVAGAPKPLVSRPKPAVSGSTSSTASSSPSKAGPSPSPSAAKPSASTSPLAAKPSTSPSPSAAKPPTSPSVAKPPTSPSAAKPPASPSAAKQPPSATSANHSAPPKNHTEYQLYVIGVEGWSVTHAAGGPEVAGLKEAASKVVIDSGTTLAYLPPNVTQAINNGWSPPGRLEPVTKQYIVGCKAIPPRVGVRINGTMIWFDSKDLAIPLPMPVKGGGGGLCISGIQNSKGSGVNAVSILGGVFMKNVVAVFDIGAAEMRLANRIR